jgi:hypothetical protein
MFYLDATQKKSSSNKGKSWWEESKNHRSRGGRQASNNPGCHRKIKGQRKQVWKKETQGR